MRRSRKQILAAEFTERRATGDGVGFVLRIGSVVLLFFFLLFRWFLQTRLTDDPRATYREFAD